MKKILCIQIHSSIKQLSILKKSSLILAVALLICLCHMPYGYYTIVRLATATIATCWGITFLKENKTALAIMSGCVMLLFQPFIKIILDKGTWNIVDTILAIALVFISLRRS